MNKTGHPHKFINEGGFGDESRIVHAVTGGTGIYRGAQGEFSFTSPSPGVLDMTLTLFI